MAARVTLPVGDLYLRSSSWGTVLASSSLAMAQILGAMSQARQKPREGRQQRLSRASLLPGRSLLLLGRKQR